MYTIEDLLDEIEYGDGLGYMLQCGLDLDQIENPTARAFAKHARDAMNAFETYLEENDTRVVEE